MTDQKYLRAFPCRIPFPEMLLNRPSNVQIFSQIRAILRHQTNYLWMATPPGPLSYATAQMLCKEAIMRAVAKTLGLMQGRIGNIRRAYDTTHLYAGEAKLKIAYR